MLHFKSLESTFHLSNLSQMEPFPRPSHLYPASIWERARQKNLTVPTLCQWPPRASIRSVSCWRVRKYSVAVHRCVLFNSFQKPIRSRAGQGCPKKKKKKDFIYSSFHVKIRSCSHSSILTLFRSRYCFQPLLRGLLSQFLRASCSLTSCLFIHQDGWMFLKNSTQDGAARRMSEIFKVKEFEPFGGDGRLRRGWTDLSNFRGILCALPSSHSSLQGLLTLISLVSSLFRATSGHECMLVWEIPPGSRMRRRLHGRWQWIVKSGAGDVGTAAAVEKNTVGFSRRISVSERGRVRRHSDEIWFAAAVQVIHAAEEIHGVLHSRLAADFSAVKLCDFKMNRFTRGRRF